MPFRNLTIELLSDTTFGSGRGSPGEVDQDIIQDELGLPMIPGKIIHGLLRDEWLAMEPLFPHLANAAERVLGVERDLAETSILRLGNARLPDDVLTHCQAACAGDSRINAKVLFRVLTAIRSQTATDRVTGAPERTTLRQSRVARTGLLFHAPLTWLGKPNQDEETVLALAVLAIRHAGTGRTRGRGHVRCTLDNDLAATKRAAGFQEGKP